MPAKVDGGGGGGGEPALPLRVMLDQRPEIRPFFPGLMKPACSPSAGERVSRGGRVHYDRSTGVHTKPAAPQTQREEGGDPLVSER